MEANMSTNTVDAIAILGSPSQHSIRNLADSILDAAAANLLGQLDGSDHPDNATVAEDLANDVREAVESRDEITAPVEGWEYWFGCAAAFRAYTSAIELHAKLY